MRCKKKEKRKKRGSWQPRGDTDLDRREARERGVKGLCVCV